MYLKPFGDGQSYETLPRLAERIQMLSDIEEESLPVYTKRSAKWKRVELIEKALELLQEAAAYEESE